MLDTTFDRPAETCPKHTLQPFSLQIGRGFALPEWEETIAAMHTGERRVCTFGAKVSVQCVPRSHIARLQSLTMNSSTNHK